MSRLSASSRSAPVQRPCIDRAHVAAVLVLVGCLASMPGRADPAVLTLPIQGALRTAGGGPIADGKYILFPRLYDTVDAVKPVWEDVVNGVAVQGGVFAVALGEGKVLLDPALFNNTTL